MIQTWEMFVVYLFGAKHRRPAAGRNLRSGSKQRYSKRRDVPLDVLPPFRHRNLIGKPVAYVVGQGSNCFVRTIYQSRLYHYICGDITVHKAERTVIFFDNEAVNRGDLIITTSCRVMSVIVSFRTSARIQELIVR